MAGLMVVVFGLMGTGKTTLAQALGEKLGWPVIHSDFVRKSLAGLEPTMSVAEEFGQGIYRESFSRQTYAEMLRQARRQLDEAPGVFLDGSYKRAAERRKVRDMARELEAAVVFIYCHCPEETVRERLARRQTNAAAISDGRLELMARQTEDFDPLEEADRPLLRLDTRQDLKTALAEVEKFLQQAAEK